jgi:ABC-2 type transport system ATP-binding protein
MLTGLLEPTAGSVFWNDRDISSDLIGFRQRLGYVPEEPHLYPFLSAREHLELVGRLRGMQMSLLERKIGTLLELFGLGEAAEQRIASYSKGMKQKVLIIAALLHDPDVLILDEPDSGLDVMATVVLRHLVRMLAGEGKAVMYSFHVMDIIEKVCTRVIVLHRGRVVADDSVERLRSLQANRSLEDVFAQLTLHTDPERTARDIADVVAVHA